MTSLESNVFTSLQNLGLPDTITAEEFNKINNGTFGEALVFIVQHILGRAQLADWRRVSLGIETIRRSDLDKAQSRLSIAASSLQAYEREREANVDRLFNLEKEGKSLEEDKRREMRIAVLLDALERKEEARLTRLKELEQLLRDKKKAVGLPASQPLPSIPPVKDGPKLLLIEGRTYDVLTTIYAHQLRIKRRSPITLRDLLIQSIVKHSGASCTLAEALADSLIRGYRSQPKRTRTQGLSQDYSTRLDQLAGALGNKERELQLLSNRSLALLHLCKSHINSISHHRSVVSVKRVNSLRQSAQRLEGHLDALVAQALTIKPHVDMEDEFTAAVKRIIGMNGTMSGRAILGRVEHLIRSRKQLDVFVSASALKPQTRLDILPINNYVTLVEHAERGSSLLLSHKLAKVEKGHAVLHEVHTLIRAYTGAKKLSLL